MSKNRLPIWYPLQEIDSLNFRITNLDQVEGLIEERLELYKSNEDYNFNKSSFETKEEYLERISLDRKAYTVIKMGVALDPKLSAWFVEVEGDLFQERFIKAKWATKRKLLDELFPTDKFGRNWMEMYQLSDQIGEDLNDILNIPNEDVRLAILSNSPYKKMKGPALGLHKMLAINFRYGSFLVKTRKAKLYRGWVIDTVDKMSTTIKRRFEDKLKDELDIYGERIETEAPGPIKRLAGQINERLRRLVKTRRSYDFSGFELQGTYEENMILYPPCIQDLMAQVNEVGYIPHYERFQLGLFLKHTGMEVDEQLEYWFTKAVDNINVSFDEFKGKAGYIIRHLYGLEGAKIDYDMPSCETIQTKMYCSFRHQEIESVNEMIKRYMTTLSGPDQAIKLPMAQEVSEKSTSGFANEACAKYLQLTTGVSLDKVYHPLQYLRESAKAFDKFSPSEETEEGEEEGMSDD